MMQEKGRLTNAGEAKLAKLPLWFQMEVRNVVNDYYRLDRTHVRLQNQLGKTQEDLEEAIQALSNIASNPNSYGAGYARIIVNQLRDGEDE
jgi:hypothetical protein